MARKNTQIFPLFEEFRRVTSELSDAQLGKVIRYAMALYYGDEELPKANTLTRFAAKTLLEQAYRYDGFRDQQRKRRTAGRDTEPLPAQEPAEEPLEEEFDQSTPDATEVNRSTPPSPVPSPSPNPIYKETVGLLNELSGSSFRPDNKTTRRLLNARLREGYTQEDMELVIRHKCGEWKYDEKLRKYLRPETLFGSKFEGYLSDARRREEAREPEIILAPLEDPFEVAVREGRYVF